MEKIIFYEDFCYNKNCPEYIYWSFDNGGCEYPKNCLFLEEIKVYKQE